MVVVVLVVGAGVVEVVVVVVVLVVVVVVEVFFSTNGPISAFSRKGIRLRGVTLISGSRAWFLPGMTSSISVGSQVSVSGGAKQQQTVCPWW